MTRVQFGAVFAAGHSPREVANWTWQQLLEVSQCIQSYHADMAMRLLKGKSPALEQARKEAAAHPPRPRQTIKQGSQHPNVSAANQETYDEFMRISHSTGGEGSMIATKIAKETAPDLFKEWSRRRDAASRAPAHDEKG